MRTDLWLPAAWILAACAPPPPCDVVREASERGGTPRNVLIVILDDVGVDQLAGWGLTDDVAHTPTVDCLCEAGTRFTQAWASPMCSPTRAELQTGRYNRRTGIGTILEADAPPYELPLTEDALPEVARRAGLTTALVGKWHLATDSLPDAVTHPNRTGYDHFAGSLQNLNATSGEDKDLSYERWVKVEDGTERISHTYATVDTIDEAVDFVTTTPEPWLLVVSFNAPHKPLHVPPPSLLEGPIGDRPDDVAKYRAALTAADSQLGRLFVAMGSELLGSTTLALLGDNGTPDHAIVPPFDALAGKGTMSEGGIRVPLVFVGPTVTRGVSTDGLAHAVDLLPTVADLLDVEPEAAVLDGRSLLPLLEDPGAPSPHAYVASFKFGDVGNLHPDPTLMARAIREEHYKIETHGKRWTMFEVGPEGLDQGDELLGSGLDEEEAAAYGRLQRDLAELEASFAEGPG